MRDPDDERILEVAVECRAAIVTFSKRDFAGADRFGIPVRTPGEFMQDLRANAMSMTVNVPEELYQKAVEIAESHHLSVDEVFASAFAEQIAEWERLQQRASRGSREKFLAVLDKVPDVEPEDFDRR
ncbi:MAG TPA: hypothetical protein VN924_04540 [Bryobacteraceae bacterium]|nr:hypothetical protein [Bryobacteraceae bacterium]